MDLRKTVFVGKRKFELELRVCANARCDKKFYANPKSKQSICSHICWEIANGKVFFREKIPRVKRVKDVPKIAKEISHKKVKFIPTVRRSDDALIGVTL